MATSNTFLVDGQTYTDVYFLKVDVSGHSTIVAGNPSDIVNRFFDHFESSVFAAVDDTKKLHDCGYAEFWGWEGDGGLCVIYDRSESVALQTAVESAVNLLDYKLQPLQDALRRLGARGELHMRIALHRGSFTYKGYGRHGSIHSKDLNFVAHLEQVAPRDTLVISRDVHQRCPTDLAGRFSALPFRFENYEVFAYSICSDSEAAFEWAARVPIAESVPVNLLPRRYSEQDKASIVQYAQSEVVDLGTALSTCSQYLVSTARPAPYRAAVKSLLERGVRYLCLALDPDTDIAETYASERGEAGLRTKIRASIRRMEKFAAAVSATRGSFELHLYSSLPHFAGIVVDRNDGGLLLYTPYLPNIGERFMIERADSPHLVMSARSVPTLFSQVDSYIDALLDDPGTRRVI